MSCYLEPAIWSRDIGQRIPYFDRCQLIIIWISNAKAVHSKPRLHVSLSTCYLEYGRHVARPHRRRRRPRVYAPTSNTANHDNHEKINSWVSFCFPYMGCLWGSAKNRALLTLTRSQKHYEIFSNNILRKNITRKQLRLETIEIA